MPDSVAPTLTYTRILQAPRELVFRCMLDPKHLTQFWGPAGTHAPLSGITVDARPGGVFETQMLADDGQASYTMRAVFDEILEPERIAWTEPSSGMQSISTFVALDAHRTQVTIEQRNAPAPFHDPQARAGFATSLDRFEAYTTTLRTAGAA